MADEAQEKGVDWGGMGIVATVILGVIAAYAMFVRMPPDRKESDLSSSYSYMDETPRGSSMEAPRPSFSETVAQVEAEQESEARALVSDLKIEVTRFYEDGNYDYVEGTVKNVGQKNIGYWKATIEFLDKKGNVIDTDMANDLNTLRPGAKTRWKAMHEHVGAASVQAYLTDASLDR